MLPRDDLLVGCGQPQELAALIDLAEQALRTWEPVWSGFIPAELRELAQQRLGSLAEVRLLGVGGWPQAERQRLLLRRQELAAAEDTASSIDPPLTGLLVSGNFLFDPAEPADVRRGLLAAGLDPGELGDIWMRGDRGAQAVIATDTAQHLVGLGAQVRSVTVQLEPVPLDQLQWPASRSPRNLTTVEASLRLDAVASAGLGLSRNRMNELIRAGAVRINWQVVTSPSRELHSGDRVRLEGRGELEVLEVQPTKRDRWRLQLRRS
jgi:photosystem II S4 domain protein